MVESCSQTTTRMKPFTEKESCSNDSPSFEDVGESLQENSVEDISEIGSVKTEREFNFLSFERSNSIQRYVDGLFLSILETVDDSLLCHCIKKQERLDNYCSVLSRKVLQASFQDLPVAMVNQNYYVTIEKYSERLVDDSLKPVIETFQGGILEFSDEISCNVVSSAVSSAGQQIENERIAHIFAERFSLRVFRDFFIHIITDANRIAYHLLGSYQAVSKNQLRTFAENIIDDIMKDLFPRKKLEDVEEDEDSLCEVFASSLAEDIMTCAVNDANKIGRKRKSSKSYSATDLCDIETYAAQMAESFFTGMSLPSSCNNKMEWNRSSGVSPEQYRRDSRDDQSEAITPKSAAADCCYWKRGIYHFADQLLYSLTALERDGCNDTISELGDPVKYQRERRSGSCPHIYQRPFPFIKELSTWRRKSETLSSTRRSLSSYAEELADVIVSSVLPSAGRNRF